MPRRTTPADPETIVAEHFPLYGPYSDETTIRAGATLYELVRYLNYATGGGATNALPYASTAGSLVGNLRGAVSLLDQTLNQLERRCQEFGQDPTLYDYTNREGGPGAAIVRVASAHADLEKARNLAAGLAAALTSAHSNLNALGHEDA